MRKARWPYSQVRVGLERHARGLWLCILCVLTGLSWSPFSTWAADIKPESYTYGDKQSLASETKRDYISQGQVYLRNFIREQIFKFMAENGMPIDEEKVRDAVSMDVTRLYADPSESLLQTKVHVYADSHLDSYQSAGRFLPVEVEVDASYLLQDNLKLKAKMEAPFNSVTVLNLGSEFTWDSGVSSILGYRLRTGSQTYDGFNLGVAFQMSSWRVKLDYDLTPEFTSFNHLSLSTNF